MDTVSTPIWIIVSIAVGLFILAFVSGVVNRTAETSKNIDAEANRKVKTVFSD